jgi:hypothetical protein
MTKKQTPTKTVTIPKDGNKKKNEKYDAKKLAPFCESVHCPWLRNVNFGNDVHSPHCVLRGGDVRPHERCLHIEAFVAFVAEITAEEVVIENVVMDTEDEEE